MQDGEERAERLRALATVLVGSHEELRAEAIRICPDLEGVEPTPDARLHESEMDSVARLGAHEVAAIDNTLVASSSLAWRKATRVIGETLVTLNQQYPGMSIGLFAQRITVLVQNGALEAKGDLRFMRLCEVRLPNLGESAA